MACRPLTSEKQAVADCTLNPSCALVFMVDSVMNKKKMMTMKKDDGGGRRQVSME